MGLLGIQAVRLYLSAYIHLPLSGVMALYSWWTLQRRLHSACYGLPSCAIQRHIRACRIRGSLKE